METTRPSGAALAERLAFQKDLIMLLRQGGGEAPDASRRELEALRRAVAREPGPAKPARA